MSLRDLRRPPIPLGAVVSIAVVVVVLVAAGLAQSSAGQRVARSLGLYTPSEPIVALAFTDPGEAAARTANPPTTPPRIVPVSFSIANLGHRAGSFTWSVRVGRTLRDRGRVTLPAGATIGVRRIVSTGCPAIVRRGSRGGGGAARSSRGPAARTPRRVQIHVRLQRPARMIDLWVRCRA